MPVHPFTRQSAPGRPPSGILEEFDAALRRLAGGRTTERVDVLNRFAEALLEADARRAQAVSDDAARLARELGYRLGLARAQSRAGHALYMRSEYEAALLRLKEALALFREAEDPVGEAEVLGLLAGIHTGLGSYERALEYGFGSLRLLRAAGDRDGEGWCLYGLGTSYHEYGDHQLALQHFRESLELFQELGDAVGEGRALNGIGTVCQALGRFGEARRYHEESLTLFRRTGNRMGEARALNDLGLVRQHLGEVEFALECHRSSLALREEVGNRQAQCTSLINLGRLHLQQHDTDRALDVLQRALDLAEEIKVRPRIYQAHEVLADAYEQKGDPARALAHFRAFYQVREEVFSDEADAKLRNLQISFELEKTEQEAAIAHLKNVALKEKNDHLAEALRKLQETQEQLLIREKLASLGQVIAGVAHEIQNPLNFVNNFAALLVELTDELRAHLEPERERLGPQAWEEIEALLSDLRESAEKVHHHGRRADSTVKNMLLHARGTSGDREPVDLHALVDEYVSLAYHGMRAQLPGFNVKLERDFDREIGSIDAVPQDLGRVLLNLLNNAFYAVHEKVEKAGAGRDGAYEPTVVIRTRQSDEGVEIRIEDNGPGIGEGIRHRIFEPFFTTKPAGSGTGLGLSMSYDLVAQGHGGSLEVESEEGGGAVFIVRLPASEGRT